jgi:hypothetical protein
MGAFEVQGIVSAASGEPIVQFFLELEGEQQARFQVSPMEARDLAQTINEAATNAIYEAALLAWAKERDPENGELMAIHLIDSVRRFRSDKWGLPGRPEDWRPTEESNE